MIGAISIARALPTGEAAAKALNSALDAAISIVDQH
jgi:hypothetical protein